MPDIGSGGRSRGRRWRDRGRLTTALAARARGGLCGHRGGYSSLGRRRRTWRLAEHATRFRSWRWPPRRHASPGIDPLRVRRRRLYRPPTAAIPAAVLVGSRMLSVATSAADGPGDDGPRRERNRWRLARKMAARPGPPRMPRVGPDGPGPVTVAPVRDRPTRLCWHRLGPVSDAQRREVLARRRNRRTRAVVQCSRSRRASPRTADPGGYGGRWTLRSDDAA